MIIYIPLFFLDDCPFSLVFLKNLISLPEYVLIKICDTFSTHKMPFYFIKNTLESIFQVPVKNKREIFMGIAFCYKLTLKEQNKMCIFYAALPHEA